MNDVKKREGDRSVSFIDAEVAVWLREAAQKIEDGLCLARFHADFCVENLGHRKTGDVITASGQKFELTIMGKRCFSECGLLQRTGRKCPLADGVAFGRPVDDRQEEQ